MVKEYAFKLKYIGENSSGVKARDFRDLESCVDEYIDIINNVF